MDPNARFARCLGIVCGPSIEGGFSDDPQDPGGATNHGITMATLTHWRGRPVTVQDVQDLQMPEATAIYRAQYWNALQADLLPAGVDLMAFDCAVNQGAYESALLLQRAVDAVADGHVGPNTIKAVIATPVSDTLLHMKTERMDAYQALPGWAHDGAGWTNRVDAIYQHALAQAEEG